MSSDSDSSLDLAAFGVKAESEDVKKRREALEARKQQVTATPATTTAASSSAAAEPAALTTIASASAQLSGSKNNITAAKAAATTSSATGPSNSKSNNNLLRVSDEISFSDMASSNDGNSGGVMPAKPTTIAEIPPLPISTSEPIQPSKGHHHHHHGHRTPPAAHHQLPPPDVHDEEGDYEELGVWLVDRAAQTECIAETQTDPEPELSVCPMCMARHVTAQQQPGAAFFGDGKGTDIGGKKDEATMYMGMMLMLRQQLDDVQRTLARIQSEGGSGGGYHQSGNRPVQQAPWARPAWI
eukprot:PhM_4_TR9466/c0_g1_i1/m.56215